MEIVTSKISKSYGKDKLALDDISIRLESPCLIGLVGPNGAGKSTLMKLLISELLPSDGTITVDGLPMEKAEKSLKAALGYLPQFFGLFNELTVWQFLDYISALKGIKDSKKAIDRAINLTDLAENQKSRIRTLSGGQRQRVGIAQALLGNPEFIVLDEPTVGLDPEQRVQFRNLLSHAAKDRLMLLSTHIIEDVQSVCNRLIVMNLGHIIYDGLPEDLIRQAQGHVGVFPEKSVAELPQGSHITARINTSQGVSCRLVSTVLPEFATEVEPTLEDAYIHLLSR